RRRQQSRSAAGLSAARSDAKFSQRRAASSAQSRSKVPKRQCSASGHGLSDLALLPEFKLPEELVLFLLGHRGSTARLLTFVDKPREDQLEVLKVRRRGYLHIALQPLLGGRKPAPARQLGRDIDLVPLWVMAGIEQRLEPGKEGVDEVDEVMVALGAELEIGRREHGTHCHGVDRLVRGNQARIILSG